MPDPKQPNDSAASPSDLEVFVEGDTARFIHDDDLTEAMRPAIQDAITVRVGHVEPLGGGWSVRLDEAFLEGRSHRLPSSPVSRRDAALKLEREEVSRLLRREPLLEAKVMELTQDRKSVV